LILLTGKTNIQPSAKIENYSLNLSSLMKRKKKIMRSSCRKSMKRTTMQSCRKIVKRKMVMQGSRKDHGERS
jgi:hypothetical protein